MGDGRLLHVPRRRDTRRRRRRLPGACGLAACARPPAAVHPDGGPTRRFRRGAQTGRPRRHRRRRSTGSRRRGGSRGWRRRRGHDRARDRSPHHDAFAARFCSQRCSRSQGRPRGGVACGGGSVGDYGACSHGTEGTCHHEPRPPERSPPLVRNAIEPHAPPIGILACARSLNRALVGVAVYWMQRRIR